MIYGNYPALGAMLSDLWCMDQQRLNRLVGDLCQANAQRFGGVAEKLASPKVETSKQIQGGIAKIPIHGVILKRVPAIFSFLGIEATGTEDVSRSIRQALADPEVKEIELSIDSPGGTISGVQQLADVIYEGKSQKPINAKVSDLAASAAYWIASQANEIEANAGALVGSIGVYRVLVDSSEAAEKEGVKVHLISSGDHKGTGTPGAPISESQLKEEQRIVNGAAAMFNQAIARGRNMDLTGIEEMATGKTWFADEARKLGLVDHITAVETPQQTESVEDGGSHGGDTVETNTPQENASGSTEPDPQVAKLEIQLTEMANALLASQSESAAKSAAMAAIVETQKLEVIEGGVKAGKIVPAMREKVADFAAFCGDDVEKLRGFVDALPVQTRAETKSVEPGLVQRDTMSASDEAVAKLFRLEEKTFRAKSEWSAISASGELLDVNGKIIGGLN
tara:strand:- start:117 stop:1472 length:1356 start_codon:yes stop_codon:yes gene_type:complete